MSFILSTHVDCPMKRSEMRNRNGVMRCARQFLLSPRSMMSLCQALTCDPSAWDTFGKYRFLYDISVTPAHIFRVLNSTCSQYSQSGSGTKDKTTNFN